MNDEIFRGVNIENINLGTGVTSGFFMTTEIMNTANTSLNTGLETYITTEGTGTSVGAFNQLIVDNTSNTNPAYGLWNEAGYNGTGDLWGVYSYATASGLGECLGYLSESIRLDDMGPNFGGDFTASRGTTVRGVRGLAMNAAGDGVSANIGVFGRATNTWGSLDIGVYGIVDSYDALDYAGYFAGPVFAAGYYDIAEMFDDDGNIPDGAIVRLAKPSNEVAEVSVEMSDIPYDPLLIGVRSENPAIVMGRAQNYKKYRDEEMALWKEKEDILSRDRSIPQKPSHVDKSDTEYPVYIEALSRYIDEREEQIRLMSESRKRLNEIDYRLSEIMYLTNPRLKNDEVGSQIGLAGRLRVLCTDINGPIMPGDPITSSEIPGYGMKATQTGPIVGYALGSLEEGSGKVVIFISREQWVAPQ